MQMDIESIKRLIKAMGFVPQNGKNGVYQRTYSFHSGYSIFVDLNEKKIEYNASINPSNAFIQVGGKTACNFSQAENFVVLECVNRLLEKGYAPSCIELEKTYPSGHGHSGRLDVFVRQEDGTPFLMIECKTWGIEYEKELAKMLENGGQLFSYYSNDRDVSYLCLYSSCFENKIEYKNAIISIDHAWRSLSGVKEMFEHWNKNFRDNGIFDDFVSPYNIKHRALTYGKLEPLKEEHSGKIYNQIMEILRHNAISDKPNAFNKLLNLFVCKIADENKNPDDELEFQWLETDTDESLQLRLNDLYQEGMRRFLGIEVIDYKQEEVLDRLNRIDMDVDTKQWIMRMYTDTRLKKSPDFAFLEVQDEETFSLNAKVVREIVELLQGFKFRYEQKHEFLGNFFELLLNTSMKQEAGQFFTPVPITRFIILSLPLRYFVQKRIDCRSPEPLPALIDYACGSGHFLTEYMSQMQKIIDTEIKIDHAAPDIRNLFQVWRGFTKFKWAKDTVYGIDLDNRLVKTTKVSAFFNGDGEAEIIWANGLDHFTKSNAYRGKLKRSVGKDNGQFDILISNPPYSVEAFKNTIQYGNESFELYQYLTDNSFEIECLFVERMKQLLKIGGWGAVILPSSILTNGGLHSRAREILLRYFRIKAIVELGSNTFMKTNINTVILFLERRNDDEFKEAIRDIDRFFVEKNDVTAVGIENAFSTYVSNVYDGITFADYVSLLNHTPTENVKTCELYIDNVKTFGEGFYEKFILSEKEKMLYFLLTYNQDIVLVKTGKGKQLKQFLGYKFSERRGHEGLHPLSNKTKLYDETDLLNPCCANSYIYSAFLGKKMKIEKSMEGSVSYRRLSSFIEYGTVKFDKVVNLGKGNSYSFVYRSVALSSVAERIYAGGDVPQNDFSAVKTDEYCIPIYSNSVEKDGLYGYTNQAKGESGSITISARGTIGYTKLRKEPFYPIVRLLVVIPKKEFVIPKYLEMVIPFVGIGEFGKSTPQLTVPQASQLRIPLPPIHIQQKIIEEIECLEVECTQIHVEIEKHQHDAEHIFDKMDSAVGEVLGKVVVVNPSKSEIADLADDLFVSFVDMASVSNDGYIINTVDRPLGEMRKGSYTYFRERDVIVAKITPCMENGKCALAYGLTNGIGMGSSEFHVFRCGEKILPYYLLGYLNRAIIRDEAEKVMTGKSGHRRVPISFYQQLRIPLPALDIQQRMVNEIKRHESEIIQLKERLHNRNNEKKAVLNRYLSDMEKE